MALNQFKPSIRSAAYKKNSKGLFDLIKLAISKGNTQVLDYLIKLDGVDTILRHRDRKTSSLCIAAMAGQLGIIRHLIGQ